MPKFEQTDFSSWTVKDYLSSPEFINWVYLPKEEQDAFWQNVQQRFPVQKEIILQAKTILLSAQFKTFRLSDPEQKALWTRIEQRIHAKRTVPLIRIWRYAAIVLLLVGSFFGYRLWLGNTQRTLHTAYGQFISTTLPDGSHIRLNGNTTLRFAKQWKPSQDREIWLNGAAYFDVTHLHKEGKIRPGERFIVHTDKMDIEVLGTRFEAVALNDQYNVSLFSGKVRLTAVKALTTVLVPGQKGIFSNNTFQRQTFSTQQQDSALILRFDQTPLREVFSRIESLYGWKAQFAHAATAERTISGTFSAQDPNLLFKALAMALQIQIEKDEKKNIIRIK